jgi:formylmethanofuran dehydrogenase subunit E
MEVLPNGRMICKSCGHIVILNDAAFRCPCSKCLELVLSPRMRRLMRKPKRP